MCEIMCYTIKVATRNMFPSWLCADVAELADALDLGSSVFDVGVQVPSSAPNSHNPNRIFQIGDGFGFCILLSELNYV